MATEPTVIRRRRARAAALRRVEALIAGSGLVIRERPSELVIVNPRDPDAGEIHIAFADGYVSWVRPAWRYLGYLAGYDDPETETPGQVGMEAIIAALITPVFETPSALG
jgi:hypothetical protein